jgi:3-phosphoglycerate kinase
MEGLSVRDLGVKGRRVLVRADFNVPTEEIDGKIRITGIARSRGPFGSVIGIRKVNIMVGTN